MTKIELNLYSPEDMEAFAVFLNSTAKFYREAAAKRLRLGVGQDIGVAAGINLLSGIAQADDQSWRAETANLNASDLGTPITTTEADAAGAPDDGKTIITTEQTAARRERGKPSPGRARRTKEEIAEDEAAAAAEAAQQPAETPQISTGESRIGPDDSPETEAQDAADEAAESEAAKAANGQKLTHDDIRNALGAYVKGYGMAAAQEDGPKLFKLCFPDTAVVKISDIPDDQDSLARALAGVKEMTEKNPYGREVTL